MWGTLAARLASASDFLILWGGAVSILACQCVARPSFPFQFAHRNSVATTRKSAPISALRTAAALQLACHCFVLLLLFLSSLPFLTASPRCLSHHLSSMLRTPHISPLPKGPNRDPRAPRCRPRCVHFTRICACYCVITLRP